MTTTYLWTPPPVYSLPVRGKTERLPVNRLFFVGRNYHAMPSIWEPVTRPVSGRSTSPSRRRRSSNPVPRSLSARD